MEQLYLRFCKKNKLCKWAFLSAESKIRLEKSPLRILDSKDYKDCQINQGAPKISQYYTGDATTGQNALNQIRVFKDAVSIGGLVVF